ncbi:MAG TPA: MHYT domain-containing protein [Pararhizobium sp.]|uniref:MHYT domain-containing protein n=1 Tax=Pararhizobium sp. TaxID=1977563 RepID=UPI002CD16242|nr:MHYT domain-containing protein [Pararhizobium sp.]HTO30515.1 MHYT domain-containing protein [Pararhizobium sp.]
MIGSHDVFLVILAVMIAMAASYTALDLASRTSVATTRLASLVWLAAATICLGGGIWAMHFVAMLSYVLPGMEVAYDLWLTVLSLLTAIVFTGVGFAVVARADTGPTALVLSGLFMGTGILAMHYVGMAAMRMHASLHYDPVWVLVSVIIAMAASIAALWLAFRGARFIEKIISAFAMGLAISGMHFAGMKAATFTMHGDMGAEIGGSVNQNGLALAVSGITFLILVAAIVAAIFDRRFAALASKESRALKESAEQFRSLYRRTPLPLHSLDADGRIEDVSDAWLTMLGYERATVIGRPLINFMTEESARQRIGDWQRLLVEGELREREYRFVTRKGDFIDVLSTSRIERDADGVFIRAVGGLVDVTARRRAEEALRQAQKMEAVGQLTGGVAHDFNNILAIILGNLEMIRKRIPKEDRAIRMVDNAIEGAQRGAALTQRMLSFSRRQSLSPQAVQIRSLVDGMHDLIGRSLGPRITVLTQFPDRLPAVFADPHQLEMVLLNLVVNARDAMEGGTITIAADGPVPAPPTLHNGSYVCLRVTDTGAGMDEAILSRAREPFFTTKGVGKGTGLGLSMASGFADQSGGALDITSQKGIGTTISIWLPVAAASSPGNESGKSGIVPRNTPRLDGQTILVVDDEALILINTESTLQELGATVFSATTALEALDLFGRHSEISCLVTDYAMPGMTGAQLAAAIRVKKPNLPIVIATGYAELPGEIASYETISKPFNEEALGRIIAQAIFGTRGEVVPFDRKNR